MVPMGSEGLAAAKHGFVGSASTGGQERMSEAEFSLLASMLDETGRESFMSHFCNMMKKKNSETVV